MTISPAPSSHTLPVTLCQIEYHGCLLSYKQPRVCTISFSTYSIVPLIQFSTSTSSLNTTFGIHRTFTRPLCTTCTTFDYFQYSRILPKKSQNNEVYSVKINHIVQVVHVYMWLLFPYSVNMSFNVRYINYCFLFKAIGQFR